MFLVPLHFVRIFRGAFPSLRTRVRRVSHHKSCFRQDREPPFTIRIPKKSQKTHTLFRNRHAGVEFLRERKRNQNNAIRNSNRVQPRTFHVHVETPKSIQKCLLVIGYLLIRGNCVGHSCSGGEACSELIG